MINICFSKFRRLLNETFIFPKEFDELSDGDIEVVLSIYRQCILKNQFDSEKDYVEFLNHPELVELALDDYAYVTNMEKDLLFNEALLNAGTVNE